MADATDFIPSEAKIEIEPSLFVEEVKNFASDEDLTNNVRQTTDDYESRFKSQRQPWSGGSDDNRGIWNQCDWAFRSCVNNDVTQQQKSIGANEPSVWERAQTGTAMFYRQVTQLASNGYAVQTSGPSPFKYEAITNPSVPGSGDDAKQRERKQNMLARWTMKKDRFTHKSKEFWIQVQKYGNIPVMVEWKRRYAKVVSKSLDDEGNPILNESERLIENRPMLTILPIESVLADTEIGNIQDQECVIVMSLAGMADIVSGIKNGYYRDDLIEDLGKQHQWDGYSGFENNDSKYENRGFQREGSGGPFSGGTGKYLKRELFVRLPINEDGKWDEQKNIPELFRVTMFGNDPRTAVVARIERNQEPDDAIPIEMIHANPDDSDKLYHISPYETIQSHIATETTLIRQVIDNNTLVCKPPLIEQRGAIDGKDRTFGPNARFVCDDVGNAIKEFNIRDISQPTLGILDYLRSESNNANSIDKNMSGESFGARTSALEANTISSNTRRPNLFKIEYVMDQFIRFYAWRIMVLWEAYADPDQVMQITDEDEISYTLRPAELSGDYDIVVDIASEINDNEVFAQRMLNFAQTIGQTPMAQNVDWELLTKEISEKMLGTSKFVKAAGEDDAEENARRNLEMMLIDGQMPSFTPGMNIKAHLNMYKDVRRAWKGREEENPNVEAVLDIAIEQLQDMMNQQKQGSQPGMASPVNESVQFGNQVSGALNV